MDEFAVGIDSLGFSYSRSNPVLKDVTIHVPKGKHTHTQEKSVLSFLILVQSVDLRGN